MQTPLWELVRELAIRDRQVLSLLFKERMDKNDTKLY